MKVLIWLGAAVLLLVAGAVAYVRLAPSDPARWHVAPDLPADLSAGEVRAMRGAAALRLEGDSALILARLDETMIGLPRTTRLAGSVEEGRITWVSRSRLWGFPDYTTAQLRGDGVEVHARLRFGSEDMGVNAARLETVAAGLER